MDASATNLDWAVRPLNRLVPDPLVRATAPEDPPHVRRIEPIARSQPDSALHDAFPPGAEASAKGAEFSAPSSLGPSVSNNVTPVKPSPPAPVSLDPRECQQMAKAKSISSSPAPSPQHTPSEPFAVNPPGSPSPPSQESGVQLYVQAAPLDRVRIRRSERHPGGCAQEMKPSLEEAMVLRDQKHDT